jgi:hypothetical protein
MNFTYSGMNRPSWGFRKATTFHHITAIYQRSILHLLLWVQSHLPRAHDEPVLNEGRQTCLPGKEQFKTLIVYKKEYGDELGNYGEHSRGTMHFTCSGMDRPRLAFRKATTFHLFYAIN